MLHLALEALIALRECREVVENQMRVGDEKLARGALSQSSEFVTKGARALVLSC
jgi:hypothetical protein